MAFDPSKPAFHTPITSAVLRDQFNALAALIEELRTRLDALPGVGTDVFISAAGNDATATMGDPARPFRTAQAAFDAARALPGDRVLRFGAGNFGGVTLAADWPERISLARAGATVTRLGGITATGAPGTNGANETNATPHRLNTWISLEKAAQSVKPNKVACSAKASRTGCGSLSERHRSELYESRGSLTCSPRSQS